MNTRNVQLRKMTISAMMLAFALLLPLLTGQLQYFGQMLCPMHLPILLCGFLCGPVFGFAIGLAAAPLRSILFGMPKMPNALYMAAELAIYGLLAGLFYKIFPKKKPFIYLSLILAMIGGRIVYAIVFLLANTAGTDTFHILIKQIISATVLTAWPGMILQIILIPFILIILEKITKRKYI
ncbi:MAG: ECF transporter S component [Clostridia bacterium]|nr:ECF transporter S component [Clostridia bacterium]